MKRSIQEIIELLVFGLIAVLIGTGLLWVVGWVIGGLGALFKLIAALIWSLLRFVVPIAVVGAAVYALVRLLQGQRGEPATARTTTETTTGTPTGSRPAGSSASEGTVTQAPQPAPTTGETATPPAVTPPAADTTVRDTAAPDAPAAGTDAGRPEIDQPPATDRDVTDVGGDAVRRSTGTERADPAAEDLPTEHDEATREDADEGDEDRR